MAPKIFHYKKATIISIKLVPYNVSSINEFSSVISNKGKVSKEWDRNTGENSTKMWLTFTSITRPTIISPISGLYLKNRVDRIESNVFSKIISATKGTIFLQLGVPCPESTNIDKLIHALNQSADGCHHPAIHLRRPMPPSPNKSRGLEFATHDRFPFEIFSQLL